MSIQSGRIMVLAIYALMIGAAHAAGRGYLKCHAPASSTCYYSIYFSTGAIRNITIKGGDSDFISGITAEDRYCITIDQGVPDERTCTKMRFERIDE